jgi:hypothetical protein
MRKNDLRLELYWDEILFILISTHWYSFALAHFRALRIPLDSKPDDHWIRSREPFTLSEEARRSPSWVVSRQILHLAVRSFFSRRRICPLRRMHPFKEGRGAVGNE